MLQSQDPLDAEMSRSPVRSACGREAKAARRQQLPKTAAVLFLVMVAVISPARAQSAGQGSIEGMVTDPSGAVVPATAVVVRDNSSAATSTATSDDHGFFCFLVPLVGTYDLRAEWAGFAPLIQKDVLVTVGGTHQSHAPTCRGGQSRVPRGALHTTAGVDAKPVQHHSPKPRHRGLAGEWPRLLEVCLADPRRHARCARRPELWWATRHELASGRRHE